jgi:aryl-alcohol dehydrogenase-like predicted oxidoreductase
MEVCEELNLHKPIGAQNMYNMIERKQIEVDYRQLFAKYGYGLAAYSPLMGGYLTGKYLGTIP